MALCRFFYFCCVLLVFETTKSCHGFQLRVRGRWMSRSVPPLVVVHYDTVRLRVWRRRRRRPYCWTRNYSRGRLDDDDDNRSNPRNDTNKITTIDGRVMDDTVGNITTITSPCVISLDDVVDTILVSYPLGLLTADLSALIVTSELIGLLNVLNDETFARSGGWLQPITTLIPVSVWNQLERFSVNAVVYVLSAIAVAVARTSYLTHTSKNTTTRRLQPEPLVSLQQQQTVSHVVMYALYTSGLFFIVRLFLELVLYHGSGMTTNIATTPVPLDITATTTTTTTAMMLFGGLDPLLVSRLIEVSREWYVVTLTTVTTRYLYHIISPYGS